MRKLIKNSIQCLKCNTVLVSRYRHDFQRCPCGSVFIDGGLDYQRAGGNSEDIRDLSVWEPEESQ